ncbi:MAG: NTP transferase domain-containing protein [Chloroflexi bacterium]|nr:NTP transferase domain-containing protein [Chloroflexota bacterium]
MTVAAVILAASPDAALADAAGVARVRRIADAAWAGGATPIVVVAPDPEGAVAVALAGAPVTLGSPAPHEGGPVAQIVRAIELAAAEISGTEAALVWPARLCWAGPETVTSLIEAYGVDRDTLLRPAFRGEAGWPALLPLRFLGDLRALSPQLMPGDLLAALVDGGSVATRTIDLGDPGTVIDGGTPRDELPPYEGPSEPAAPHAHEWGAAVAATPEEAPLRGPALAPYGPAEGTE